MDSSGCGVPPFCADIQCFGMFRSAGRGSNKPNVLQVVCPPVAPPFRLSVSWPGGSTVGGLAVWASNCPKRALNKQTNNANHEGASETQREREREGGIGTATVFQMHRIYSMATAPSQNRECITRINKLINVPLIGIILL